MNHTPDDATLFELIQQGHAAAFETLYDRYSALVYTFALKGANGNRDLASEITQDVFVRLWTTKAEYRSEIGQFTTWLLTITRRISLDKFKKYKAIDDETSLNQDVIHHQLEIFHSQEQQVENSWFRKDVFEAMKSLSAEERLVIELVYFQGMTLSEIAKKLNRPKGTIKTWLHKALQVLRKRMQGWEGGLEQ